MPYTKTTFVNGTAPGISAAELNKIGDGIATAQSTAESKPSANGATWTGTHNFTGATLDFDRDTDYARIYLRDDGTNLDHLAFRFGDDDTSDYVAFEFATGGIGNAGADIMRVYGNRVAVYRMLYYNDTTPYAIYRGGGANVWVQSSDPGGSANEGDVWFQG